MNPNQVFINCPFDNNYFPLLKPLLFVLIYIGLVPKISETSDSGENRLNTIKKMMLSSKFSIHDLSRIKPFTITDLPRFNMPFECGFDFGIKMSNSQLYGTKKILILETEQYRYKKFISDISGNDIKAHKERPETIIKVVRDWFKLNIPNVPRYKEVWLAYNEFTSDFESILTNEGYNPQDINALTFCDIIENMSEWITEYI
ncbi:MAG: hypothetical protein HN528_13215 [Candidatus Marinimicrobia bacterium]|jgi:hypothetical protein|nr:hypothetical protein [Candidatus Neomarinimicrobiota bacterium]